MSVFISSPVSREQLKSVLEREEQLSTKRIPLADFLLLFRLQRGFLQH